MEEKPKRVLSLAPIPPEKCAYALARYSRSPDSIRESLDWVRRHDSEKFLEHFYFQYGHASIADLGHILAGCPPRSCLCGGGSAGTHWPHASSWCPSMHRRAGGDCCECRMEPCPRGPGRRKKPSKPSKHLPCRC
jgi:hypothetical protein